MPSPTGNNNGAGLHPSQDYVCEGSKTFDVRVHSDGLGQWEGKRVWAFSTHSVHRHTSYDFIIRGKVTNGAFDLSCTTAVEERYDYPGIIVWVDTNDSDVCEPEHDAIGLETLYGWADHVDHEIKPALGGAKKWSVDLCQRVNAWL